MLVAMPKSQGRASARPRLEARALVEGDEEGLGGGFLGPPVVEPAPQVAEDHAEVALEDDAEGPRF